MSQKHYAIKASVNQHSGVRGLECLAHSEGARRKSMAGGNPEWPLARERRQTNELGVIRN